MRVPRFLAWAQNLCGMQFSILGYGDIIVPGEVKYHQFSPKTSPVNISITDNSQFEYTEPTHVSHWR